MTTIEERVQFVQDVLSDFDQLQDLRSRLLELKMSLHKMMNNLNAMSDRADSLDPPSRLLDKASA